ncbi:MAG: tetratricopeptide repeat protein [Lachnospiraceae bacterium]|nr:tetratricopeptide repeat protein [Lachnospiraceae bacterium]
MSETNYSFLSVCIITRDQREKLEKCLKAVRSMLPGAETVVLDTGSTDGSVDTARKYADTVGSFTWCDDFSAAKNAAVDRAGRDYVLILDTDEYIDGILPEKDGVISILKGLKEYPDAVGRIKRCNSYINEQGLRVSYDEWINRIFDRRLFRYEGRIHEQVVKRNAAENEDIYDYRMYRSPVRIFHDGYDLSEEELRKKAGRNMSLIIKETEENPDDPYLRYQLGKTAYRAGDKEKAAESLLKALELRPPETREYLNDLICLAGYSLLDCGRAGEGLSLLESYRKEKRYSEDADFLFLYAMLLMNVTRFDEARETFISCTSLKPSSTEGTSSFMAWYNAGVISEVLGDKERAIGYYSRAGEYEPAKLGFRRLQGK